ncbi:hypothetical protein HYR69_03790 [Candidatus Sumerlaeota bacterium]|nr:hypothetical protein [Candidatus Sumerlaeota bacterium]MBI3735061.1 hypothetical protein [Candidatus Sumerlaeota bacterium]
MQAQTIPEEELPSFTVKAKNFAKDSENKIHGDEVAARYGFRGGLVPGIGVYAYMTHPVVARLGREWLERGNIEAKFIKPVYDGDLITVGAKFTCRNPIEIALEVRDSSGQLCAVGKAGMQPDAPPQISDYPQIPAPSRENRREARAAACPPGTLMGCVELKLDLPLAEKTFVADVLDPLPIYRRPGAVAHPALLLAQANCIVRDNINLGPWIHTASAVRNFGVLRDGESLSLRGRIADSYVKRGHEIVELDLAIFGPGDKPIQHILHSAIIRLAESA